MSMKLFFPADRASKQSSPSLNRMAIFELDPVERIAIAAVGEPGKRQFFLLASGSGRTLTLACEKSQIQALVARLHQMMEAQGIETEGTATTPPVAAQPGEPEWRVAEMGLGYHEGRRMFVLVASEGAQADESPIEDTPETAGEDTPSV